MRILNRKEFLALEGEVVFAKYEPCFCGDLGIKIGNCQNDFVFQDLSPLGMMESEGSIDLFDKVDKMELDNTLDAAIDLHCYGRDGHLEEDQKFVVLSSRDVAKLISRLLESLGRYSPTAAQSPD